MFNEDWESLKSHVSEIVLKQIRINQGIVVVETLLAEDLMTGPCSSLYEILDNS